MSVVLTCVYCCCSVVAAILSYTTGATEDSYAVALVAVSFAPALTVLKPVSIAARVIALVAPVGS